MQQGESQYGVPPPPSESGPLLSGIPGAGHVKYPQPPMAVEAVSPISSRPPSSSANPEELTATVSGNFEGIDAGEDTERGGVPGNRWPREETLALIKIRSDMDAAFRDATLKGPLWEDVSRKLAEQGYKRSAKKCKEKFENVHKYYKRTKEGRTGRQDGKSYRFFTELEALHNSTAPTTTTTTTTLTTTPPSTIAFNIPGRFQPTPLSSVAPPSNPSRPGGISFSTNSSSSSQSDTDGDETEDGVGQKRKQKGSGSGRKTMAFFKDLMKKLMDQQEEMQRKFLETIEKREQDRMIREEAWKRQEMARLSREHEAIARERDATASRDTAIIAFLQKMTGQTIQLPQQPTPVTVAVLTPVVTPVPPPPQSPIQPRPQKQRRVETQRFQPDPTDLTIVQEHQREARADSGSTDPASSRWPKAEVHALIKLRSGLDARYQDAGPKGPLWEEISAGMQKIGYNRSAKRCKEKWENINKYFKKVKESNKKRPEDAKTCPYFHQLDALYRKKSIGGSGSQNRQEQDNPNPQLRPDVLPISTMPPPTQVDLERKNGQGENEGSVVQTNNGDVSGNLFEKAVDAGNETITSNKPEDMMKEIMMMENQCIGAEEDYDDMDEDEDEEEQKMAYKIEFQRPNGDGPSNGTSNPSSTTVTATAAGSFLAMVQ